MINHNHLIQQYHPVVVMDKIIYLKSNFRKTNENR